MTEFEEKVLEELKEIKKQNADILEVISKSIDTALGADTFNVDNFENMFNGIK